MISCIDAFFDLDQGRSFEIQMTARLTSRVHFAGNVRCCSNCAHDGISGRHREKIARFLRSLQALDYPLSSYEIIVADNNSSDQTFQALKELQKSIANLKVCQESRIGVSYARNNAVGFAKFQHLIFMDDDINVKKSHLQAYHRAWEKYPEAGAIGGKIETSLPDAALTPAQRKFIRRHDFCFSYLNKGEKDRALAYGELLFAPNMSCKRRENETRIFDTRLGKLIFNDYCLRGEEYELCKRLMLEGKTVMYVADPDMEVTHYIFPCQFQRDHIIMRYYIAGIENYIIDTNLKSEFPHLRSPLLAWAAEGSRRIFSGLWLDTLRHCFSIYFLVMKVSYFFNGKYFNTPKPLPK